MSELGKKGCDLALWISCRYKGEAWLRKLCRAWATNPRSLRGFLHGTRRLRAEQLYLIEQMTGITMAKMMEQAALMRLKTKGENNGS